MRRARTAELRALLGGPAGLAVGTVVLGASGYAFLTLTARFVSSSDYAALASLYLLVALIGPGLFMPLEQEATRVVATYLAQGLGTRDAITQLLKTVGGLLLIVTAALAVAGPLLVDRVFAGHTGLWWALLVSVFGYGATSVVRGVLAATRRLGAYGLTLGVDGAGRLLPCLVLGAAGATAPVPYGLGFGLGPLVGLVAALALLRLGEPGPRPLWRDLITGMSWLAVAWVLALALANIGPVIVTAMLPEEPARAGTFAFVFVLVRVPLFVLLALQPVLLPLLTHAAASHDIPRLRTGLRRGVLLVSALGIALLLTAAPVGQWLVRTLFDDAAPPSFGTITLLATGTLLAMLVQVLQPALLAVASHRVVALAWVAGAAGFGVAFLLPIDVIAAATAAQLAAGLVTAGIMTVALRRHLTGAAMADWQRSRPIAPSPPDRRSG